MDKTAWGECFNYVSYKKIPPERFIQFRVFGLLLFLFIPLLHFCSFAPGVGFGRVFKTQKWLKRFRGNVLITFLVKSLQPERCIQFRVFGLLLFLLLLLLRFLFDS